MRYSVKVHTKDGALEIYWLNFIRSISQDAWNYPEMFSAVVKGRLEREYNAKFNKRKTFVKFKTEEEMVGFLLRWS